MKMKEARVLTDRGFNCFMGCTCCGSAGPGYFQAGPFYAMAASGFDAPTNIEANEGKRRAQPSSGLIVDCHGHYTTEPQDLLDWRKRQIAAIGDAAQMPSVDSLKISDDQLRQSVEGAQLKLQRERGTAVTLLSPRASGMSHHIGDASVSADWSRVSNDLIYRLTQLYPKNFVGVCQLPQSPDVRPENCIDELVRCVTEL